MRTTERVSTGNRVSPFLFGAIVIGVYVTEIVLAGMLSHLERPAAVAVGMTLDMIVLVPAAFYFLVVRRGGLPLVTLAPVIVLSFVAANLVLPAERRDFLAALELGAVPLEIGLVGWIVLRAVRALRASRRELTADPLLQFHHAGFELLGSERLAAVLATEIAVLYYAFFAWRTVPHAPAAASAFTHHRQSAHAGTLLAILLLVVVEGLGVHFLLALWSTPVAWTLTFLSAYTALWLIGDFRATVLRPILVEEEHVRFRAGLRWTLDVPRERIVGVQANPPRGRRDVVNLTFLGSPTHWITLSRPVPARGPYGIRREVQAIGFQPDEAANLERHGLGPS